MTDRRLFGGTHSVGFLFFSFFFFYLFFLFSFVILFLFYLFLVHIQCIIDPFV